MSDPQALSEAELKKQINIFRQQIDQKEREIRSLYQEMNLNNQGAKDLRSSRDELNQQSKNLRKTGNEFKSKRDEINKKINELKQQKEDLRNQKDGFTGKIGELKKVRDELNKFARGRLESLNNAYREEFEKFSTADIPLEYEQILFKNLSELGERLNAICKANVIHNEMGDIYGKVNEFHQNLDTINALIRDMAAESQKYHESMVEIFKNLDEIKQKSDEYHQRLVAIYEITRPIKGKIDVLKKSVTETRAELDIYLNRQNEIQLARDEKEQQEKRVAAKDKLKKSGKISLDDLRVLMENNEIEFG